MSGISRRNRRNREDYRGKEAKTTVKQGITGMRLSAVKRRLRTLEEHY